MIYEGDCQEVLRTLPPCSVQTCVTSPPYFGLRDYGTSEWDGGSSGCDHRGPPAASATASTLKNDGRPMDRVGQNNYERQAGAVYRDVCRKCGARRVDRQIGLEPTPDEFVAALVSVFREVRRVLRDDGTVWLNLGDSYSGSPVGSFNGGGFKDRSAQTGGRDLSGHAQAGAANKSNLPGIKQKDLIGVPWMVAFALRADGWYLRSDIIWSKPNPMPESVRDRPTRAHEYLFLLSKGSRYFYDADAIREPLAETNAQRTTAHYDTADRYGVSNGGNGGLDSLAAKMRRGEHTGANRRSVWSVPTQPYSGAHFATFPPKLIEPCILAGSSPKACGECGAPYGRLVERSGWPDPENILDDQGRMKAGGAVATDTQRRKELSGARHRAFKAENPDRFLGWSPSCQHHDDTGRSVVLDPFAGSGTTGVVAAQHGRDFIGIELNPEYAAMARERILIEGKPGYRGHEPAEVHEHQLGMFG